MHERTNCAGKVKAKLGRLLRLFSCSFAVRTYCTSSTNRQASVVVGSGIAFSLSPPLPPPHCATHTHQHVSLTWLGVCTVYRQNFPGFADRLLLYTFCKIQKKSFFRDESLGESRSGPVGQLVLSTFSFVKGGGEGGGKGGVDERSAGGRPTQ